MFGKFHKKIYPKILYFFLPEEFRFLEKKIYIIIPNFLFNIIFILLK